VSIQTQSRRSDIISYFSHFKQMCRGDSTSAKATAAPSIDAGAAALLQKPWLLRNAAAWLLCADIEALGCTCKAVAASLSSGTLAAEIVSHMLTHCYGKTASPGHQHSAAPATLEQLRWAELKHVSNLLAAPEVRTHSHMSHYPNC
jgi:hypothetical protein